jgi:hypothetical protein
MLVTGWPPNRGGPRMPQRAMTSSRSPSTLLRTIGASWSGKIPGMIPLPSLRPPTGCRGAILADEKSAVEYNSSNLLCPSICLETLAFSIKKYNRQVYTLLRVPRKMTSHPASEIKATPGANQQ